jgi:carbonic anhydrase/acetyltransferase-like protein (isoleucine patch superfamily)
MSGNLLPYLGVYPRLGNHVFVAPTAMVIGDVEIGAESNIWFGSILRGDVNIIRIGARTNIQDGSVVHVSRKTQGTHIGSDVTIGHMVLLHACTLEDGCFIGMHATVMDGVIVESGAMVAAGALVTPGKRVRAGELWAGTPARCLRRLSVDEQIRNAETAPHYVRLGRSYLDAQAPSALPAAGLSHG